jgi:guanylate kinase
VGKGTLARRLLDRDERLWLSRSWTTRSRRAGESEDAYVFVDHEAFEAMVAAEGFLEWAEFLGNLYGTPLPEPPAGSDVLLEIDVEGARQVRARVPDAHVVLVIPPSEDVQVERLRGRGDSESHVAARVARGHEEIVEARRLADAELVNDDLEAATATLLSILAGLREARAAAKDQAP